MEPYSWLCLECYGKTEKSISPEDEGEKPFQIPFMKLFLLGFILIFIGTIILVLAALFSGLKDSLGLILLIGPIPIIFGAGEYSLPLLVIAAILTVVCVIVFIFLSRRKIRLLD